METSSSTSSSNTFDQDDDIVQDLRFLGLEDEHNPSNHHLEIQESPALTQWFYRNSVSTNHESIWGSRFFFHGELGSRSPVPIARNRNRDRSDFRETGNRTLDGRNTYNSATNNRYWWHDPSADIGYIHATLSGEQCPWKERLVLELQSDLVSLMTDKRMCSIFHLLLDASEQGRLFDSVLITILLDPESFINAAFCKQGARSITKLIRKLKRSSHDCTMMRILSTRFMDLMTHYTGRNVVQACFTYFRHETNEPLYEMTILNCHYLARDKVGCRSLNECLGTISGEQRWRILDKIADISDTLCDDHYGNYVLQKVMQVSRGDLNQKIINCLRSKFIDLSQRQTGSHIVEKCLEISRDCMQSVIEEILKKPNVLAKHKFGNYVVQKALRLTMERSLMGQYNALVNSLRPHFSALAKTRGGKCVINVINELSLCKGDGHGFVTQ